MIYAEIEYVKELNRPLGLSRNVLSKHYATSEEPWVSYRMSNKGFVEW